MADYDSFITLVHFSICNLVYQGRDTFALLKFGLPRRYCALVSFPDPPTKNGGRVWEMGLYVRVAGEFVPRNYMQPQSGRAKTTWTADSTVYASTVYYVAAAATASVTAGSSAAG